METFLRYLKITSGWVDIKLPFAVVGHMDDLVLDGVVGVNVRGVHLGNSPPRAACLDYYWWQSRKDGGVVVEVVEVHLHVSYEPNLIWGFLPTRIVTGEEAFPFGRSSRATT